MERTGCNLAPVACALCGAQKYVPVYRDRVRGFEQQFIIVRCAQCGLLRVASQPTPDEIARYYESYESRFIGARVRSPQEMERLARRDADEIERLLSVLCFGDPTPRVLDIGCGQGHLVAECARRGWGAWGAEVSQRRAASLRSRIPGAQFIAGSLPELHLPQGYFDVVMMKHVLEHVAQPARALDVVRRGLRPGGVLLCEVPDVGYLRIRLRRRPMVNQLHLWHFTPRTLRRILEQAGFRVLRTRYRDERAYSSPLSRVLLRRLQVSAENWLLGLGIGVGCNLLAVAQRPAASTDEARAAG